MVTTAAEQLTALQLTFLEFFRHSRILKIGLAFNIAYYLAVSVVFAFLRFSGQAASTIYQLDFQVFFAAAHMLGVSPADLYSVSPNGLPYRYLPFFAFLTFLFTAIVIDVAYVAWIVLMMLANWANLNVAYRLCQVSGVSLSTKNFEKTLLFLYIAPQHIINLMLGQVSQIAILLVLSTLLILHRTRSESLRQFFLAGLLLGLAVNLKPFMVFFALFLLPMERSRRYLIRIPLKPTAGAVSGFTLSMLPNIAFFLMFPPAFGGFVNVNVLDNLEHHHSTSITRLLAALVPCFQQPTQQYTFALLVTMIILLLSYIRFVNTPNSRKSYVHHFAEAMFAVLIAYPDSWFLFIATLYALLGPSMLTFYNFQTGGRRSERLLDVLWSSANNLLAFFWIGVVVHYLVLGFDPIVPLWVLATFLLYELALSRHFRTEKPSSAIRQNLPTSSSGLQVSRA